MQIRSGSAHKVDRYCSPYLASAFLFMLGGYLSLYHQKTVWSDLQFVFTTQILYAALLVVVIGYLFRGLHNTEDPMKLLPVLVSLALDVMLIQARYDYERGDGLLVAAIGAASGILAVMGVTFALGLPLANRLTAVLCAQVLFVRFGPAVLMGAQTVGTGPQTTLLRLSAQGTSPAFVALAWMLAATLLPFFLLPALSKVDSTLPLKKMERAGILLSSAIVLVHFASAGRAFDLAFRFVYLAPFVVLLSPALERLFPVEDRSPALQRLCDGLPFLGLALAATTQSAPLWGVLKRPEGPLTPFWFVLLLVTIVQVWRSYCEWRPGLLHGAGIAAALSLLGGNFPEIVMQMRYPESWQVLAALLIISAIALGVRRPHASLAAHLFPSLMMAGWLADRNFPWSVGFLLSLVWGALLLDMQSKTKLSARSQATLGAFLTLAPTLVLLADTESAVRLWMALGQWVGIAVAGVVFRRRLYLWIAAAATIFGLVAFPLAVQQHGDIPPGRLFVELGFVLLLAAFLNSLVGPSMRQAFFRSTAKTQ